MPIRTLLRRTFLALSSLSAVAAVLSGCAGTPLPNEATAAPAASAYPPIVFVHGNGDSAALWLTTIWRFESQGWPRERLVAIDLPYPLSRDDDAKAQPGRTSTAEHMAFLKAEVERTLQATGARQVVLFGNSRGGHAIRNYVQNGGGSATVSHAILGGTPNHGIWAIKGFNEGSEYAGTGPFLTGLNAPKNAQGDEVTGPVRWMTIRSDNNDKYAQPDGLWIGAKGKPTLVGYDSPALRGAENVVIPRIDHRETAFSPAAFAAAYRFITGQAPRDTGRPDGITPERGPISLDGRLFGLGLQPEVPASGNYVNNLPLPGAQLAIYAVDASTGARLGPALHERTVGADGRWGPFLAQPDARYEFVIRAPGYATTHIYRSPFPRGSRVVQLRAERIAEADRDAKALITFTRPRGYFDAQRDTMRLDGQSPPPGIPPSGSAGLASSKLKLADLPDQPIRAEFNGETVVGRPWPVAEGHAVWLELTQ